MERMRTLSNDRDRGEIGTAPAEDEPVADADFHDGEGTSASFGMWKDRQDIADIDAWVRNLRWGRFDVC